MKPKTYHTKLLDMEDNIKMCVFGFRDISSKRRPRYLLAVSPENKLKTTTTLLLYSADREIKDVIYNNGGCDRSSPLGDEWYTLNENNMIYCRDTNWCFIIEKHGTAYMKCKNLQAVMNIVVLFESDDELYDNSNTDVENSISFMKSQLKLFSLF